MRIVILVLSLLAASVLGARAERQDEQFSEQEEERVKRFIYYKDTKWCGIGNRARNYHDLGRHRRTDMCCRSHDKCKYWIPAFRRKWRLFNLSLSTIMHCDCDNQFHACLKRVNNAVAKKVGSLFFNILRPKCFRFKKRRVCVKRGWWLKCKRYKVEKTAVKYSNKYF